MSNELADVAVVGKLSYGIEHVTSKVKSLTGF